MTESIRIDADAGQLLMEAVDNIVMTASMVAMAAAPFTGGASLQILIPLGAVGAGTSIYRLMHSSEMGTLHYDLNFAMEIINIASAFIPGIAAVAGVGSHFMVEGTLIILDGVNLMLVGVEAIHAIQNIDPSTPRELRNAQVARIIGNAGMQFGMTALGNVMGEIATRFEGPAAPNRTDPNSPHTDADAPNSSPESIPEGNNSTNHPDDSTTQNPHDDTSTRDQGEQHPDQEGRRTDADEPESTQVPEDSNTVGDDHTDQGSDAVRDPGGGTSLIPNSDLPTVNHTQSAESYLHDNEIRLLHREEIAMLEFLNTATSWREAMTILQARPEPRFRTIEQNIMTHRDNICNRLFYEFDAAPVSGASSTPISDVDLSITGANAGIKLIAAENFMRARFGDAWSALLRMNFYTEASRLTQYESVQSLMTPEQFGAFQIELTRISEQFNYAKMLQHAEGDPAQVASVHEMMSHVPPEIRARAEELAASPASSQTDRRNALLAEVDNLVVDFNTARDAGDQNSMIRLAEEITRKQVECNYLTDEAYIGPGAGRMVVNQVGVTGHEAYQSAISQLEMIQHTIHESGGLVPALRDYEIYKYLHRLCESIRVSENDTAYDRMSRMIYREERGYMQMHET